MMLTSILILLTLVCICGQIATVRQVRALQKRIDAALAARHSFREGSKLLRERLDKRFGVRL